MLLELKKIDIDLDYSLYNLGYANVERQIFDTYIEVEQQMKEMENERRKDEEMVKLIRIESYLEN